MNKDKEVEVIDSKEAKGRFNDGGGRSNNSIQDKGKSKWKNEDKGKTDWKGGNSY